jgi:hypothetical protein
MDLLSSSNFGLLSKCNIDVNHSLGHLTMEIAMQSSVARFAQLFALLFLIGGVAMAQTTPAASPPTTVSKAALRKQDKQECTKQAEQQNIARRNRAGFVRQCMSDRQGTRKATAK